MRPRAHPTGPRAFRADAGGAAAVEFAIVAVPFLALCAAVVQAGLVIWAGQNFERSVQVAARALLTGQFQNRMRGETDPAKLLAALRGQMCGPDSPNPVTLFDCAAVKVDVASAQSFGTSTASRPTAQDGRTWDDKFGSTYVCAKPGAIVVVTAAVAVPTLFGRLGIDLRSLADGSHLLMSTAVFRTEPYQSSGAAPCAG